jgi:indole-3-glycerol phosphate synthase
MSWSCSLSCRAEAGRGPDRGRGVDEAADRGLGVTVLDERLADEDRAGPGADIVLLIVAALDQARLGELHSLVSELGMTALVETHNADEVSRALDIGAALVGVNARNLNTFELDQDLFGSLADRIPSGVIRVAESAVTSPADVAHYRQAGADVVLVGEALVTDGDPVTTLQQFLAS